MTDHHFSTRTFRPSIDDVKSAKITVAEFEEMVQASQDFMDTNVIEQQTANQMRNDLFRIRTAISLLKKAFID